MDREDFRDGGDFQYYVGGYETTDGHHYNVEAGDPPLTEEMLSTCDYISVYIEDRDEWFHINGPFDDWIDVEYDIADTLDEY